MNELNLIQTKLNAPKNQVNKFGGYNYRNCEGILEALKPLLEETKCTIILTDEVLFLEHRFYIKATATIKNAQGETETAVAYAREEENKKGMDTAQLTGATSSYARKYALNGLFAIDDNKDFDAGGEDDGKKQTKKTAAVAKQTTAPKESPAPAAEPTPQPEGEGIFDSPELQDAIEAAKNAQSAEELSRVWKDWRPKFGTFHEFVDAVKSNPNYPKK